MDLMEYDGGFGKRSSLRQTEPDPQDKEPDPD
jgi:hypothetical protein